MVQYQWFEIKFNPLGGLTNKKLNKGNYNYNSFLIYVYIYIFQYHSFIKEFYQSYYTQTLPPKKFMTIANINAINSNMKELGKPIKTKKNGPLSFHTQQKVETFYYLEQEIQSDRKVIWNTAAPIALQVTTVLTNHCHQQWPSCSLRCFRVRQPNH